MKLCRSALCYAALILALSTLTFGKKRKSRKESPETSLFNFLRLFVFRLIYGLASMVGAEEGIEDFMGGILVPPSAGDSDYTDFIDVEDDLDY